MGTKFNWGRGLGAGLSTVGQMLMEDELRKRADAKAQAEYERANPYQFGGDAIYPADGAQGPPQVTPQVRGNLRDFLMYQDFINPKVDVPDPKVTGPFGFLYDKMTPAMLESLKRMGKVPDGQGGWMDYVPPVEPVVPKSPDPTYIGPGGRQYPGKLDELAIKRWSDLGYDFDPATGQFTARPPEPVEEETPDPTYGGPGEKQYPGELNTIELKRWEDLGWKYDVGTGEWSLIPEKPKEPKAMTATERNARDAETDAMFASKFGERKLYQKGAIGSGSGFLSQSAIESAHVANTGELTNLMLALYPEFSSVYNETDSSGNRLYTGDEAAEIAMQRVYEQTPWAFPETDPMWLEQMGMEAFDPEKNGGTFYDRTGFKGLMRGDELTMEKARQKLSEMVSKSPNKPLAVGGIVKAMRKLGLNDSQISDLIDGFEFKEPEKKSPQEPTTSTESNAAPPEAWKAWIEGGGDPDATWGQHNGAWGFISNGEFTEWEG